MALSRDSLKVKQGFDLKSQMQLSILKFAEDFLQQVLRFLTLYTSLHFAPLFEFVYCADGFRISNMGIVHW